MTTTPNMLLVQPVPSDTDGPLWATMQVTLIERIDVHDHSSGYGVKVTPAGLNITSDLAFNDNDATELRSVRFEAQGSLFALAADVGAAYMYGGELYFRDASGNNVKITNGGVLNAAALNSNLFPQEDFTSDQTILAGNANTHFATDASVASRSHILPAASAVSAGRYYLFSDSEGSCSASRTITITRAGADTIDGGTSVVINQPYGWVLIVRTSASRWRVFRGAQSATATAYGTLLLAGDLGGTAAAPSVAKINGATVPAAGALTTGHVLMVSGASALSYSALPDAAAGTKGILQLGTDLSGSAAAPTVVGITGSAGVAPLRMQTLQWPESVNNPFFGQSAKTASGAGGDLTVYAQDGHTNGGGGDVIICGGNKAGVGLLGRVELATGGFAGSKAIMVEVANPVTNQTVLALCGNDAVSSTDMPSGTGDGVVFLGNAFTAPTADPANGCILFAQGGVFGIRNEGGNRFTFPGVASTATPSVGAASAPPATPEAYLTITHNGATYKLAAYKGT